MKVSSPEDNFLIGSEGLLTIYFARFDKCYGRNDLVLILVICYWKNVYSRDINPVLQCMYQTKIFQCSWAKNRIVRYSHKKNLDVHSSALI